MYKLKAPDGSNNICAKKLIAYRTKQGLSQRGLARKLQLAGYDLDNHFVRRIETGERFVTDIEILALCSVLGVRPDEFLSEV